VDYLGREPIARLFSEVEKEISNDKKLAETFKKEQLTRLQFGCVGRVSCEIGKWPSLGQGEGYCFATPGEASARQAKMIADKECQKYPNCNGEVVIYSVHWFDPKDDGTYPKRRKDGTLDFGGRKDFNSPSNPHRKAKSDTSGVFDYAFMDPFGNMVGADHSNDPGPKSRWGNGMPLGEASELTKTLAEWQSGVGPQRSYNKEAWCVQCKYRK
jgi:hypothetical protein